MWTMQYHKHLRAPPFDGTGVSYLQALHEIH